LNKLEGEAKKVVELALGLSEQFPGDVGISCALFLQVVDLAPGDVIFLGAGKPHAYVSGGVHSPTPTHLVLHLLLSSHPRTDDANG
jgi:mannose-6-phosphate isomerase class I